MMNFQFLLIILIAFAAAYSQKSPQNRLERIPHYDFFCSSVTLKNVYESAMEPMSFGNFGSTKNVTGISRVSPAFKVWLLKQKQAILLKYSPASSGPKLGTA